MWDHIIGVEHCRIASKLGGFHIVALHNIPVIMLQPPQCHAASKGLPHNPYSSLLVECTYPSQHTVYPYLSDKFGTGSRRISKDSYMSESLSTHSVSLRPKVSQYCTGSRGIPKDSYMSLSTHSVSIHVCPKVPQYRKGSRGIPKANMLTLYSHNYT